MAQTWQKSWNFWTDLTLDMLVVCSNIHVLGSPLMSVVVTRMQDLASEFSKKISGVIPPDHHSGRGQPTPTCSPVCGRARGQAPRCRDLNLGPPQLFSSGCAPLKQSDGHPIKILYCGTAQRIEQAEIVQRERISSNCCTIRHDNGTECIV